MNEKLDSATKNEPVDRAGPVRGHGSDCAVPPDLARLPATLVHEARPVYGDPGRLEQLRLVADDGLPVDSVKVLQSELKRFGVRRASEFVNRIVPRATRMRRERLTREEGEAVLRVAALMALAVYVWGEEEGAAEFLTTPHMLLGHRVPIDLALSEVGVRHVEDILWGLHYGLPV
jgi:putative toxin-antitoxin system antitoxin component (TIGR02293 family)